MKFLGSSFTRASGIARRGSFLMNFVAGSIPGSNRARATETVFALKLYDFVSIDEFAKNRNFTVCRSVLLTGGSGALKKYYGVLYGDEAV
jgi:hypothetical protein